MRLPRMSICRSALVNCRQVAIVHHFPPGGVVPVRVRNGLFTTTEVGTRLVLSGDSIKQVHNENRLSYQHNRD